MIPLTTADMDFRTAEPICQAIREAADFGVFGYTQPRPSYYEAVMEHLRSDCGWSVKEDWITYSPGIVSAVALSIQGMTKPGDGVALLSPIYHPFSHLIEDNQRMVVRSVLRQTEQAAEIDFCELEQVLSRHTTKMLIFCNPHNPIGRAWTEKELEQVGRLCIRYGVILISDEIHSDFVFSPHRFISMGPVMERLGGGDLVVVCTSASKSYNIAGLQCSNILIPSERLRTAYRASLMRLHYMEMNAIGPVATEAAYRFGRPWLMQLAKLPEKEPR